MNSISPLVESRPPATTWAPDPDDPFRSVGLVRAAPVGQPLLDLFGPAEGDLDAPAPEAWRAGTGDVRVHVVRARWTARPRRDLPDVRAWSVSLALALVETMHGRRAIAQLNRWLADEVLTAVTIGQRRARAAARAAGGAEPRAVRPPVLRLVRIQHPHPEVAEVTALVALDRRCLALAFRLEAFNDRWLCTAVEAGPPR